MPGQIEDPDELVFFLVAGIFVFANFASERVGRGPRISVDGSKALMGLSGNGVDIEFKWNDNMQDNGNIMDFYVNGDTAPGGRFNYVYTAK